MISCNNIIYFYIYSLPDYFTMQVYYCFLKNKYRIGRCHHKNTMAALWPEMQKMFAFCALKGSVHPKIKIQSLFTLMSFQARKTCSSSEHKLRYFGCNLRAFWPCIDSNTTDTFKAQKGIKDIIKIVLLRHSRCYVLIHLFCSGLFYSRDLHKEETMFFEAHCMSFPCTELVLFNYAKVNTVSHSMAPLA